jgi:hypothetical protein
VQVAGRYAAIQLAAISGASPDSMVHLKGQRRKQGPGGQPGWSLPQSAGGSRAQHRGGSDRLASAPRSANAHQLGARLSLAAAQHVDEAEAVGAGTVRQQLVMCICSSIDSAAQSM